MVALNVMRFIAFTSAFLAAAGGTWFGVLAWTALKRESAVQKSTLGTKSVVGRLLRNGVGVLKGAAEALVKVPAVGAYLDDAVWFCERKGVETSRVALGSVLLAGSIVVAVAGGAVSQSLIFAVLAPGSALAILGIVVKQAMDADRERIREAIPDVLHGMSACFHAGYSLLQTFRDLAEQTDEPLKGVFAQAAESLEMGETAEDVLASMRQSSALRELEFVIVALDVQHQTGGSMQEILDTAREAVEGELSLRRSLRVQTAQARLSARLITIMPFVLIALLTLVSGDFLTPFFSSVAGFAVLVIALSMQAAGVLCVRRMLNVKEA